MMVGASAVSLGLSAGGLFIVGPGSSGGWSDLLLLLSVLSAFVMICSTEARHAG